MELNRTYDKLNELLEIVYVDAETKDTYFENVNTSVLYKVTKEGELFKLGSQEYTLDKEGLARLEPKRISRVDLKSTMITNNLEVREIKSVRCCVGEGLRYLDLHILMAWAYLHNDLEELDRDRKRIAINHMDCDHLNNDLSNLEVVTVGLNTLHARVYERLLKIGFRGLILSAKGLTKGILDNKDNELVEILIKNKNIRGGILNGT